MSILIIDDDIASVNLLNPSGLYLARDGWRPKVAPENDAGDGYDDVVEVIKLYWMQTSDNDRDTTIQLLNQLDLKARQYWRLRKTTGAVWMEARSPSESNSRFARIKSIEVMELDSRHWGPNRSVDLVLTITREGAFSEIKPTNNSPTAIHTSVTRYNSEAGGNSNRLTVNAADVSGDALALPLVQMVEAVPQETIIVALRARETAAEVNNFVSHLNAANFQNSTDIVSDGSAPGGSKWERTGLSGTASQIKGAPLPNGLQYYAGSFLVYAVVRVSASHVFSLTVGHGSSFGTLENAQPPVAITTTTNYQMLYGGQINMPAGGVIPGMSEPSSYYINLQMDWAGASSATFAVRNIFLVPTDDGVVLLHPATVRRTLDSRLERVYSYTSSNEYWSAPDVVRGKYLKFKPGHYNQLHFFSTRTDGTGGVTPADTFTLTLKLVKQYLAIRGNT